MADNQITPEQARASLQSISETETKFHGQLRPSIPTILSLSGLFGIYSCLEAFEGESWAMGFSRPTALILFVYLAILSKIRRNKGIKLYPFGSNWIERAVGIGLIIFFVTMHRLGEYWYLNDLGWAPFLVGFLNFAAAGYAAYKIPYGVWLTEKK